MAIGQNRDGSCSGSSGGSSTSTDTQTQAENLDRSPASAKALPLGLRTPDGPAPLDLHQLRDYRLLALLGESDTSRVYKALDTKRDRLVAVKVLSADPLPDEKARRRFERDVQAVGKLDHPHLVRMTDAGEADGIRFLVTEYVEGIDLRQLLRARGRLPAAEACEMVRQAALGLDFAHRRGLRHGNVKPSNLVLSVKRQVKLLDLGVSLMHDRPALDEQTAARRVMSTIDYIAPEQALDAYQADERSDIYSLGVTLYHLLTGSPPCAKTPEFEQRPCTVTPVDHVAPRVPAGLAQVVAKTLSHDPRERYASAAEVAEALSPFALNTALPPTVEFVAHEPAVPSAPAGWVPKMLETETVKLGRVRARWPLVVGLVAAVALVLAAVTVSIRGDRGTLVVEVDQSGAAIVIDGDDDRVQRTVAGKRMEIELLPGTHEMRVNKDGFVAETRRFEIARGDRTTFRVELRQETPDVPAAAARRRLIGGRGSPSWAAGPASLDHAQPHDQRDTQPQPRDTSTLRLLVDDHFTSPTSGFGEWSNDIFSTAYVAGASQYQVIAKQSGIWSPG
ncbi:MAG TPA: serine/threonine-protein kinase, partial [Pirellulales bacterium]|nr:serine/threonine-protein kinase [Pirellulales bacterium]